MNPNHKKSKRQPLIFNYGIDAEWHSRPYQESLNPSTYKINPILGYNDIPIDRKASTNNLIAIAIEDWQTGRTTFYEHRDYGAGYVDQIWEGFPSICNLIGMRPLSQKESEEEVLRRIDLPHIKINLHFFFSPYDILAFLGDKTLFRQLCLFSRRKRVIRTEFKGEKNSRITQDGYYKTPWTVWGQGSYWNILIGINDYSGIAGNAGYAKTCASYGILLPAKSLMDDYKSQMNIAYDDPTLRPEFINYTIGDVKFKALNQALTDSNSAIRRQILNIPPARRVSMTKGSETATMFLDFLKYRLSIFNKADIPALYEYYDDGRLKKNNNVRSIIKETSVKGILEVTKNTMTGQFLAMVMGGRCKNEAPHNPLLWKIILSMDLKSCYGLALLHCIYPIGLPVILQFFKKSPDKWLKLRDFLSKKKYKDEIAPGCWSAVISTSEKLTFNQSLFMSNDSKNVTLKTNNMGDENVNIGGRTGIYLNEIENGILTHHSLQTARSIMSKNEWGEFQDKVKIKALCFYPKSLECSSVEELTARHLDHENNTIVSDFNKRFEIIETDSRCRYWYRFNISEFVEPLIKERNNLKSQLKNLTPGSDEYFNINSKQELLKLTINSLYGALASQYFDISNVVVANNITDKARSACFTMASTSSGLTSITDGSESPLDGFLKFKRGVSMNSLTNYRFGIIDYKQKKNISSYSLGGYDWDNLHLFKDDKDNFNLEFPCGSKFSTGKKNESWDFISELYSQHIKEFFANCRLTPDWVSQFSYEDKGIYKGMAVQSASNYYLEKFECDRHNEDAKIKARGWSLSKTYFTFIEDHYDPQIAPAMQDLLTKIYQDEPIEPYPQSWVDQILKVNEWNEQIKRNPDYPLLPGETISERRNCYGLKSSAFYYPSNKYRKMVEKLEYICERESSLGLGSLWATNDTYNYQEACRELQTDIITLSDKEFNKKYKGLLHEKLLVKITTLIK